jgi:hypothetical protein
MVAAAEQAAEDAGSETDAAEQSETQAQQDA